MKSLIEAFPQQLKAALHIASAYIFTQPPAAVQQIVIAGLGGSGIGAEIIQNYLSRSLSLPLIVCKDYFLPGFVGEHTLVIACSYSGNTEESLMALEEALTKKARVVVVCSGGQMAAIAREQQLDCILIPSGMPPRACLGYAVVQLLRVLQHYGYVSDAYVQELQQTADFLTEQAEEIEAAGRELAEQLYTKLPIIYADQHISGLATRWRQQINENGKMLAWERVLPEMNHNELVGWRDKDNKYAVVFLQSGLEPERIRQRIAINKEIIKPYTQHIYDVMAKGITYWERAFYLSLLGDWLSWHLAQLRGVDATEVKVIDFLKGSLASTN